jgi:hypothetical protein
MARVAKQLCHSATRAGDSAPSEERPDMKRTSPL